MRKTFKNEQNEKNIQKWEKSYISSK
jgi:hypothetical protein